LRVFPVETVERFHLGFFLRVRANHAHAGEVFLRARRNLREKVLNLFESSVNLLAEELNRQRYLITDLTKLPGARMLDGQFTAVQQAVGTPKARTAAAAYLKAFVEDVKASGFVGEAITRNGSQGVSVAPPAR
jgi:hypothetical protein